MDVQVVASVDTWIWKAVAYAVSQLSTTWLTVADAPRSTCSHCGSEKALDHRVVVSPSTAALAGVPAFSTDDADTGLFCDSSVGAAFADTVDTTITKPATSATAAATATAGPRRRNRSLQWGRMDISLGGCACPVHSRRSVARYP